MAAAPAKTTARVDASSVPTPNSSAADTRPAAYARGEPIYDGIAELWFEDRASMERALASPQMAALHADGALFIGANKTFVVEEKTIIA